VTQHSSTSRLKAYSMNIIWPTLGEIRPLYVWRVRIDFDGNRKMFYSDFSRAGMHRPDQRCSDLIELTANALSDDAVALMLVAVQKDHNLDLSIKYAVKT
jgi:hypothetical protein